MSSICHDDILPGQESEVKSGSTNGDERRADQEEAEGQQSKRSGAVAGFRKARDRGCGRSRCSDGR